MFASRSALGKTLLASAAMALCVVPAAAQDGPVEMDGELTVVGGIVEGDVRTDADVRLGVRASTLLDNGVEVGAGTSVRADIDAPDNAPAGGRYSSLLAGGTKGFGEGDVFLEGAYLFARGGFGSLHLGRDEGVASRLAVTSPTIFRSIGVNDWRTDLTGLNDVHTVNDFSGQATKLTYMAPPGLLGGLIGQFQLGVSYAPELERCGADRCAPEDGYASGIDVSPIGEDQRWQDVVETALYYQNGFRVGEDPLRIGVSASYVRADSDEDRAALAAPIVPLTGDYRAYAFGLNLNYGKVTLGGSLKSSNAGLDEDRDEDYLAFDAGVTYDTGEWNFMIGYGAADSDRDATLLLGPMAPAVLNGAVGRETQTAQAGVSYVFDRGVTLGAAAQIVDSEKAPVLGGPEDAAAVMFESSIKF